MGFTPLEVLGIKIRRILMRSAALTGNFKPHIVHAVTSKSKAGLLTGFTVLELVLVIGIFTAVGSLVIPVSYTHLTLPTTPYV